MKLIFSTFLLFTVFLSNAQSIDEKLFLLKQKVEKSIVRHRNSLNAKPESNLKSSLRTIKLDSIVDYTYDTVTNNWDVSERISFVTDSRNRVTESILSSSDAILEQYFIMKMKYNYNANDENYSTTFYLKEPDGRWTRFVEQTNTYVNGKVTKHDMDFSINRYGTEFNFNSKVEYNYVESENLTVITESANTPLDSVYSPVSMDSVWTTDEGLKLKRVYCKYSSELSRFVADSMNIFEYNAFDAVVCQFMYRWVNNTWNEIAKIESEYDTSINDVLRSREYTKEGDQWNLEYITNYTYNEDVLLPQGYRLLLGYEELVVLNEYQVMESYVEKKKVGNDENDLIDYQKEIFYVTVNQPARMSDIETLNKIENEIIFGPNPANDYLTISSENMIESISIQNILGEELYKTVYSNQEYIDISFLSSGTYVLIVKTSDRLFKSIFVKE